MLFLKDLLRKGSWPSRMVMRVLILLKTAEGKTGRETNREISVSLSTIYRIRSKYRWFGLQRALDEKSRPGRPKKVTQITISQLTALACSDTPEGRIRWTIDLLLEKRTKEFYWSIKRTTVWRILNEHNLQPWKKQMWCIAEITPEYLKRMYDLLELYNSPYDPDFPVICIDEKSIQIESHIQQPLLMTLDHPHREDYQYKKGEVLNFFVIIEPKAGYRIYQMTARKTGQEFAFLLKIIVDHYQNCNQIAIVVDNFSTHKPEMIERYFTVETAKIILDKLEWHFTPVHASWLNMAETEIAALDRQCLGRKFKDKKALKTEIQIYLENRNVRSVPINWTYSVSKAEKKFPELATLRDQPISHENTLKKTENYYDVSFNHRETLSSQEKQKSNRQTLKITELNSMLDQMNDFKTIPKIEPDRTALQKNLKFSVERSASKRKLIVKKKKMERSSPKIAVKQKLSVLSPRETKIVQQTLSMMKNPILLNVKSKKPLKLTWSARLILELLKSFFPNP